VEGAKKGTEDKQIYKTKKRARNKGVKSNVRPKKKKDNNVCQKKKFSKVGVFEITESRKLTRRRFQGRID
jgi:hypothetical protein